MHGLEIDVWMRLAILYLPTLNSATETGACDRSTYICTTSLVYGTGVQYTTTCELVGRLGWCALERFQFVDTAAPIRGTGGCSVPGPDKNGHGAARCAQPILY